METIGSAFEAWKSGPSRQLLIRLLEASQHPIYGTCFEILRHRQDAEDAAQRVLVEIQEGLDRVADAEHYLRRLRLTAFRTSLDARRDRRRRIERERKASDMNPPAAIPDDIREAVHEAMAALDEESRGLVIEHYFEKATLDDMGHRRGISAAAVWKRIEALKGRLREALALAGLGAAAVQAEACLESAGSAAAPVNLVTGSVLAKTAALGGGLMAAKMSTAAVATLVATFTFALGLGGGLAIQAARGRISDTVPPAFVDRGPSPEKTSTATPAPKSGTAGADLPRDPAPPEKASAEDRLTLAREIWAQFSRPRFWKDRDAQDETLPKLKLLGPDLAGFFIGKFQDQEVKIEQKREAVRLAITCGGEDAAALALELVQAPQSAEAMNLRLAVLAGLKLGNPDRPIDMPVNGALLNGAMALRSSDSGWDRALAMNLLSFGDRREWFPILTEAARTDRDGLIRSETVEILVARGGAEALAFLREHKETIRTIPLDSRNGPGAAREVEFQKERLGRVVDEAITDLEKKLK